MKDPQQGGFTLVELAVTMAVMVPLLAAAFTSTSLLSRSVSTNERLSDMNHTLSRITANLYALARPARASTVRGWNRAASSWDMPLPATEYVGVQFDTDDPIEPVTELQFVRDSNERANSTDDDGDGLIDEGSILIRRGSGPWAALATRVEAATFRFDGGILTFTMRCARRDEAGRTLRAAREIRVHVRNS